MCHSSQSLPVSQYCNPLDVLLADPCAIRHQGSYYLYATSDFWNGYHAWTSKDLVNWQWKGYAYQKTASTWAQMNFWAPEVIERNGIFYMYYTAQSASPGLRICLATSNSPLGPFVDVRSPLFETGLSWIDAHPFIDDDGTPYLYCVKDISTNPQSEIHVAPLTEDMTQLAAEPSLCIKPSGGWEGTQWNEGPFVIKHQGTYYLMYSGNFYGSNDYSIGYATSDNPLGPWIKASGNPILHKTDQVSGPGHHTVVPSPDGTELFIVYHTHQSFSGGGDRQLAIDRLRFVENPGGPDDLIVVHGPSSSPQDYPSGAQPFPSGGNEDFSAPTLDRALWTIFNENPSHWRIQNGQLIIQTEKGSVSQKNSNLKNLFMLYAPSSVFQATTRLDFTPRTNGDHAFMMVWQNHNNYLCLSKLYQNRNVYRVIREINGVVSSYTLSRTSASAGFLRIARNENHYDFYESPNGNTWNKLGDGFDVDFPLVKVGIGAATPTSGTLLEAAFDSITIESTATPTTSSFMLR